MRYGDKFGFYELNPFPGSNQIVVSNHSLVYEEHRGKGIGSKIHYQRLQKAAELGYDYIMCTVRRGNEPQLKILRKFGWRYQGDFKSTETGNDIEIWGRTLGDMRRGP